MNDLKSTSMSALSGGMSAPDMTQRFSLDTQGFDQMRQVARQDPNAALKQVAKQVDASFLSMMLKSMRDATPSNGLMDSQEGKQYTSMLDGQLAQNLSGKGMGLADALLKQLSKAPQHGGDGKLQSSTDPSDIAAVEAKARAAGWNPHAAEGGVQSAGLNGAPIDPTHVGPGSSIGGMAGVKMPPQRFDPRQVQGLGAMGASGATGATAARGLGAARGFSDDDGPARLRGGSAHANAFIERLAPAAEAASRETGIPSHFILSQVALESGWGKSEIRGVNGARTHNVLGVKAGSDWKGATVRASTTEYVNGRPHTVTETFRSYHSYEEAMQDYASVLKGNARFQPALRASNTATGFANGMQKAGYATDPHYARKLLAIIKQMV